MRARRGLLAFGLSTAFAVTGLLARSAPAADNTLMVCTACHIPHDGKLDSIESVRMTPEGWRMTLSRMVRNHGLQLKQDEAHRILKYLADNYGLAPSEIPPFEYALEERNSTLEDKDKAGLPPGVIGACVQCHSFARIALQRRTPEMWRRLPDLHEYFVPFVASDTSSSGNLTDPWREVATGQAVPYFTKRFPFQTAAWTRWQAAAKPDYSGKWLVVGHDPAKGGDYTGTLLVTASGNDEYSGKFTHRFEDGSSASGTTAAVLYTKFQWRGHAQVGGKDELEIFFGNENGSMMRGRRLLTPIGDLGMDETLYKVGGGGARLLTVIPGSIQAGHTSRVRLFGMNLPASVNAGAISLGRGIKINSVTRADDNTLLAEVSADANAAVGPRKAAITGVAGAQAMYLYKTVDYIAITPERGYGRPGGTRGPKVNQQFEANGFTHGPDGKPVNIGRVGPLKWDVAERVSRIGDDDVLYCGNVNQYGTFIANTDGPNPERAHSESNVGDVWVEAWYQPDPNRPPMGARAFMLLMPPKFVFNPIN
ncbi:MAG TPA: quinohemoprotein amine dehydrogenase subunit alpha [Candidatus Binataceae bacterium]|nr:quinohemoprotein amine dehydrogenase subunit alpha [Candidatus Binataceae bacterium]